MKHNYFFLNITLLAFLIFSHASGLTATERLDGDFTSVFKITDSIVGSCGTNLTFMQSRDKGSSWKQISVGKTITFDFCSGVGNLQGECVLAGVHTGLYFSKDTGRTFVFVPYVQKEAQCKGVLYSAQLQAYLLQLEAGQIEIFAPKDMTCSMYQPLENYSVASLVLVESGRGVALTSQNLLTTTNGGVTWQREQKFDSFASNKLVCESGTSNGQAEKIIFRSSNVQFPNAMYFLCTVTKDTIEIIDVANGINSVGNLKTIGVLNDSSFFIVRPSAFTAGKIYKYHRKFDSTLSEFESTYVNDEFANFGLISSICTLNIQCIVAVGSKHTLYLSTDAGESWQLKSYIFNQGRLNEPNAEMRSGLEVSPGTILCGGNNDEVFRSVDGGALWKSIPAKIKYALGKTESLVYIDSVVVGACTTGSILTLYNKLDSMQSRTTIGSNSGACACTNGDIFLSKGRNFYHTNYKESTTNFVDSIANNTLANNINQKISCGINKAYVPILTFFVDSSSGKISSFSSTLLSLTTSSVDTVFVFPYSHILAIAHKDSLTTTLLIRNDTLKKYVIVQTNNAGTSWNIIRELSSDSIRLNSILYRKDGAALLGSNSKLYLTEDNFKTLTTVFEIKDTIGIFPLFNGANNVVYCKAFHKTVPMLWKVSYSGDSTVPVPYNSALEESEKSFVWLYNAYPVPSTTTLSVTVGYTNNVHPSTISLKVYNSLGEQVADLTGLYQQSMQGNHSILTWDVSALPKGLYIMRVNSPMATNVVKFLKGE